MKVVFALSATVLLLCLSACQDDTTPAPPPAKAALLAAEHAAEATSRASGQKVYESFCASCHATGSLHAPKVGDRQAWSAHIEHGMHHMVDNAIRGVGSMPPKGGNPRLSDDEIRAAVEYMVEQSR